MFQGNVPLKPKHPDGRLKAIVIGRVSTEHQDTENIDASFRYVREHLARMYDGPVDIEYLGERASGMLADRTTIRQAEELIEREQIDLVIAEDLSRIYRNPRLQYDFVQNAVDHGCRVICIADNLDTGTDHWEVMLGAAAFRHGTFLPDVRRRVRRTATHAFHHGGMVLRFRYGYRRLSKEEAVGGHFGSKGLRIAKVPECTEWIRQMCRWVQEGVSYVRIAQNLNDAGVAAGPYSADRLWTAANIVNLLRDPILSGTRRFRVTIHEPVFGTGKHRRRKSDEPETKVYPELGHLTIAEQDALWRAMDERAEAWRLPQGAAAKRSAVPRCEALWPGQSATCAVCGGHMYVLGRYLKCQNALPGVRNPCWNHVQASVELIRQKFIDWLIEAPVQALGSREPLTNLVGKELERMHRGSRSEAHRLDEQIANLKTAAGHLAKAIAKGGRLDVLVDELKASEAQIASLRRRQTELAQEEPPRPAVPVAEQVSLQLRDRLVGLCGTSYEFGDVLRRAIRSFTIMPVQAIDTPLIRPRGRITLDFGRLFERPSDGEPPETVSGLIDFFEPPQHIRWLQACTTLRAEDPRQTLKQIAGRMQINHMTVKRAFDYARRMRDAGLVEPYRVLLEPPTSASRWKKRSRSIA